MLMAEELPGKEKHMELQHSQQDDRHVTTKKVLKPVKVLKDSHFQKKVRVL